MDTKCKRPSLQVARTLLRRRIMKTIPRDPETEISAEQLDQVVGGKSTAQVLEQGGWIPSSGGGSTGPGPGAGSRGPGGGSRGPGAEFEGLRAENITTPDMTALPDPDRERRQNAQIDQMWNQMFPK